MNNGGLALKSGIWYTVSNFFTKAIGFITIPIFTRILSKEEFGLYNNFTSWLSIVAVVITLQLNASLISARYDYEDEFDGYIFSLVALNFISVCLWGVVVNLFASFFVAFTHVELVYINAMLIYLLFSPVVDLFQTRERFFYRYKISALLSAGIVVVVSALSIVLVLNMDNRLSGRIYGMVIPVVLVGVIISVYFLINGKHIKVSCWKYAIPICLPYIPHLLAGSLLNSMDRVMIERFCGAEDTAIYSLAYNCGGIVTLLISSLNTAFVPWLGEMIHNKNYGAIRHFSNKYIVIFLLLAVVLMLIAPEILFILGGTPYMEAKYVITPVAMGCVCQFLYTMYVNVEQFSKKTFGMAIATVLAAAINYVLNLIFIPVYGYLIAAYTTLIGFLSLLVMHMYLVKRIGLYRIYDGRLVIGVVIVGIIVMAGITCLYRFETARYIVTLSYILIISLIGYREKDTVKILLKR